MATVIVSTQNKYIFVYMFKQVSMHYSIRKLHFTVWLFCVVSPLFLVVIFVVNFVVVAGCLLVCPCGVVTKTVLMADAWLVVVVSPSKSARVADKQIYIKNLKKP